MKKEYISLIIVLSVISVLFLSIIVYNQWPHLTGKKVILATQPVDPFDPFMGQYMVINYEISTVNVEESFDIDDTIYVTLLEDGQGVWREQKTSKTKPKEGIFIKGTVKYSSSNTASVEYGIEQYFFERNAQLPTRNITVEAVVSSSGKAKIVQLYHNGKPVEIKYEKIDYTS